MRTLFLITMLLGSTAVSAATAAIDFEATQSGPNYSEDGFLFSTNAVSGLVRGPESAIRDLTGSTVPGSASTIIAWGWGPDTTDGVVTMENTLGVDFDLLALDAAEVCSCGADLMEIVGTYADGSGTISHSLAITGYFASYDLTGLGFNGLSKVEFVNLTSEYPPLALDNIVFSASVVPVPAAAWLFGSALVGLGWLRRK